MAKPRGTEAKLIRLRALRREPIALEAIAELRSLFADKSNLIVAEAATVVGEQSFSELALDLAAAFHRLMIKPIETDPRCLAKIALAEALNRLEYDQPDVFLAGLTHFQEAGPPGQDDPGARLRGIAGFGLMRINYPNVVILLTDLLHDRAVAARVAALQALGDSRSPTALPLLRYKARLGDDSPEVVEASLTALMTAAPRESLPFVAAFLHGPHADAAALALAESRLPEALDLLIRRWPEARRSDHAETLLLAIAMTRLPASLDFLLNALAAESQFVSAILSALTIHRHNSTVRERIAAVLAARNDEAVTKRFVAKFVDK